MSNLCYLTGRNRVLLNLHCLMHTAYAEAAKVVLLALCLAIAAYNLGKSVLCHNRVLLSLAVKHFAHRNATESGNGVSISHLGESGYSSLHKVVRV